MEDWSKEQAEIHNDLLEDGVMFTLTRTEQGEFDPIEGGYTGGGTTTFKVPGIVKLPGTRSVESVGWQPGTTVLANDKILLLSAGAGYQPRLEDVATVSGVKLKVKAFATLEPGQVALLYYVLVRKS